MKLHIYIESGISEERKARRQYTNEWYFVRDYVKHLCPDLDDSEFEIVGVGGKDKLPSSSETVSLAVHLSSLTMNPAGLPPFKNDGL